MAGTLFQNNLSPYLTLVEGTEPSAPSAGQQRLYIDSTTHLLKATNSSGTDRTIEGAAAGAVTSSGLTMATARLLGRTTGSTGAIEEITVGTGLSLSAGSLTATGGGVSACMAQRTTNQSISADPTAIIFNAADLYDPDGWHDTSTNNTQLICPTGKGGKMFIVTGSLEHNGGTLFYIRFRKNGTTTVGQQSVPSVYTGTASAPVYLADGDYVEMLITNQTSGSVIQSDCPTTFGIMG